MPAADRPYRIVAVKLNGDRETIGEGYTSRGHCFASATNAAIVIKTVGNPDKVDRLELENVRGEGLPEYNNSPDLCIATCDMQFNYDQRLDEFVENPTGEETGNITGNRVFVSGRGAETRFRVEIDDFGGVLAALNRLTQRFIPTFRFPKGPGE